MKKIFTILGILFVFALVFRPPVAGGKLTSWWGLRPGGADGRLFHTGSDIAQAIGTPVNPIASGKVQQANSEINDGRGIFVTVSHFGIIQSRYYHLNSLNVSPGDSVNHKTVIGTVGETGTATGPHVCLEFRLLGIPLPAFLLTLPGSIFK
ncbi:MAG: M23 family metallopeptidase [Treponema sp.]|nr:M23 family metallopeptidase [Treponema sp.]